MNPFKLKREIMAPCCLEPSDAAPDRVLICASIVDSSIARKTVSVRPSSLCDVRALCSFDESPALPAVEFEERSSPSGGRLTGLFFPL